jgi:ankyrin repeat protein
MSRQPDRRTVLRGAGAASLAPWLATCNRKDAALRDLWTRWQADWRWMEAIALRRQWEVTPLRIAPPASAATLAAIEQRHGLKFPPQLRSVLTELSAHVQFGWHIPSHLRAMDLERLPTSSANRSAIWDLAHIDSSAIPNFLGWKRDLARRDISEAPNRPELWENQFAFYDLVNGDMLTIDMSHPEPERQPVRYFSHELEMIHGLALAPDFLTFISQMARLGHAGTEWWSMAPFSDGEKDDTFYLRADSAGGRAWLAWLAKEPTPVLPDAPPTPIVEQTAADRALLDAARANSTAGVIAALDNGARIDVVPSSQWMLDTGEWPQEFATAITYATLHDNIALLEQLVARGATLNTRRLALGDAVEKSALATVQWLIAHGARANGWKDQRFWPLHLLVTRRDKSPDERAAQIKAMTDLGISRAQAEKAVPGAISPADYRAMLEALLQAGADPDAPWDNGITMLMWGSLDSARLLLKHGARVDARDIHGRNAMHWAQSAEKIRLLAAHGADVNALATPKGPDDLAYTPLQAMLLGARAGQIERVRTLIELGADPRIRDRAGRSSLAYCLTIETFDLIAAHGLDPLALQPGGNTLLHNLAMMTSPPRATFPEEVAFFRMLLARGIDINARNAKGQTLLHLAASRESDDGNAPNFALLLAHGADPSVKDAAGKRAHDLVPRSLKQVRAVLK